MKIGIAGLGFMGATHLNAISQIAEFDLDAVCTTNARALEGDLTDVGGNLEIPLVKYDFSKLRKYSDWRELVKDSSLEAIDICLPTDLHPAVAIAAMEEGKHVLCEKPMALTAGDCDRLLAAADKNKRVLMIGQVLRFWPEYEMLRDFVRGKQHGAIGSVKFRRSAGLPDWSRWLPVEERSGGAVVDLLIHDIDQAVSLFGMPESVSAISQGPVDTLSATLSYANDVRVEIEGGWLPPGNPFAMGYEARAERAALELAADGLWISDETGRRKMPPPEGDAYRAEIAYFADCCGTGARPERCLPEESAQGVKLAALLKESRRKEGERIRC